MNKTLTILLGVVAGAAFALVTYSRRGRKIRKIVNRNVGRMRDSMATSIEQRAKSIHDSAVSYS